MAPPPPAPVDIKQDSEGFYYSETQLFEVMVLNWLRTIRHRDKLGDGNTADYGWKIGDPNGDGRINYIDFALLQEKD